MAGVILWRTVYPLTIAFMQILQQVHVLEYTQRIKNGNSPGPMDIERYVIQ